MAEAAIEETQKRPLTLSISTENQSGILIGLGPEFRERGGTILSFFLKAATEYFAEI